MSARGLVLVASSILLAGCSLVGIRSGYEQARYDVVGTIDGGVEIRRYESQLVAQTAVPMEDDERNRDEAFRRLFAYISGANKAQTEIAMTAPVETGASGEEIAMTVPVETTFPEDGRYVMRFFLPTSYTRARAPEPTDPSVEIVELPSETMAALRFSGSWNEQSLKRREGELLTMLAHSNWRPTGTPSRLFYDPPWTIPFLRRNEVVVPVVARV